MTLCLNKYSIKYLFIIPIWTIQYNSIKYNVYCWNPVGPPLAASEVRQTLFRDYHHTDNRLKLDQKKLTSLERKVKNIPSELQPLNNISLKYDLAYLSWPFNNIWKNANIYNVSADDNMGG